MKRLLLLGLSFGMAATSWAQLSWGTQIGQTYYDLHSNRSTGNRLVRNDDGSMSAVWIEHWDFLTTANEPKPAVRGFGYNHFDATSGSWSYGADGECWEDPFGCASSYVGWPEIINMPGATWNDEMVISHTPVKMTSRANINSGSWSNTAVVGNETDFGLGSWEGTWPRAIASGNTIHMIVTSQDINDGFFDGSGVEMPCVYSKSSDGGSTWSTFTSFDVSGIVPDTIITPIISYDTVGTDVDTMVMVNNMCTTDTIYSGTFTVSTDPLVYDADVVFTTDTFTIVDTLWTVSSGVIASDTVAFVEGCYDVTVTTYDTMLIIDTIIDYDTTFGTQTINLVESVGADAYAIHANGNVVAVTFGGGPNNDWFLFKSTDNGDTWTRKTIRNNHNRPVDFLGQGGSNGYITNNSVYDIVVDDAGTVHVFAGMSMTDGQFVYADEGLYKDAGAGILYWNDGMAENAATVVAKPDYGSDGDTSNYNVAGGEFYGFFFQGWPAASVDNNGGIYLIYSAVAEQTEFINPTTGDTVGYNDLYMVYSKDNGATWECMGDPINIAEDVFGQVGATPTQDDLYAVALPEVGSDNMVHFTWQGDWSQPGLALYEDTHPNDNLNYIHYASMDVSGLTAGACDTPTPPSAINELNKQIKFNLIPNPAKDIVTVSAQEAITSVSIVNMVGQTVKTVSVNAQFTETINVSDLVKGMYIVRIETAAGTATSKLDIVK